MNSKPIRRRASVVLIQDQKILGFWAIDPTSKAKYFFLPGGMIEPKESPTETAERESLEEVGWSIEVLEATEIFKMYDFVWDGVQRTCHTYFFLGKLLQKIKDPVNEPDYHHGVDWIPLSNIDEAFAYEPSILEAVKALSRIKI